MTAKARGRAREAASACAILLAFGTLGLPPTAWAQGAEAAGKKESVRRAQTATSEVTIKSIDRETRRLVVSNDAGETFAMKAPPEVQRFDELKVGDRIKIQYTIETEIVLSAPNAKLPEDAQTLVTVRGAKGDPPAAGVANRIVVTGAVVGVDKATHTLKLVSPEGGEVHTITVHTAEGLKAMDKVKIGDTITAYVTESLIVAVNP